MIKHRLRSCKNLNEPLSSELLTHKKKNTKIYINKELKAEKVRILSPSWHKKKEKEQAKNPTRINDQSNLWIFFHLFGLVFFILLVQFFFCSVWVYFKRFVFFSFFEHWRQLRRGPWCIICFRPFLLLFRPPADIALVFSDI